MPVANKTFCFTFLFPFLLLVSLELTGISSTSQKAINYKFDGKGEKV